MQLVGSARLEREDLESRSSVSENVDLAKRKRREHKVSAIDYSSPTKQQFSVLCEAIPRAVCRVRQNILCRNNASLIGSNWSDLRSRGNRDLVGRNTMCEKVDKVNLLNGNTRFRTKERIKSYNYALIPFQTVWDF